MIAGRMARIRIVDEWLRSPASPPTHQRTVMVVAEKWAEQRVLMRAYAESRDQIRPTIVLYGQELAISPAGIDPNGPWGIHVQPPTDGNAQELLAQLELAARRMSGAKGNPPRLADEESTFERKPTNNWAPGTPPDRASPGMPPSAYSPPKAMPVPMQPPLAAPVAYVPSTQAATYIPNLPAAEVVHAATVAAPAMVPTAPSNPGLRRTPVPVPPERVHRAKSPTSPGGRTALGYQSGAGAQSAVVRLGLAPAVSQRLARLVNRTVPADFQITKLERDVLNAIGEHDVMTARAIGQLLGVTDPVGWMEQLLTKLERFGLDIVEPGPPRGGEPTYVLRR
jgi:hypothetical protein